MSVGTREQQPRNEPPAEERLELHSADRMSREEFHSVYRLMPEDFKVELIGGIVYVSSPLKRIHATRHLPLGTVLLLYAGRTPGLKAGDNGTVILGEEDEPQPDLTLRILPEFGGQSRTTEDDCIEGAPELAAEIAHSSRALDFHGKKEAYTAAGVLEYIVLSLKDRALSWFDLKGGRELPPGSDGIIRSQTFPGLWVDPTAIFAMDAARVVAVVEAGLASTEHAAFAARLKAVGPQPAS